MRSCWDDNDRNRPSFKALKEAFAEFSSRQAFHTPPLTLDIFPESLCYRIISNARRRIAGRANELGPECVTCEGVVGGGEGKEGEVLEEGEGEEEGERIEREESSLNTGTCVQ